jgi:energy-coupling factor transport system permease protein
MTTARQPRPVVLLRPVPGTSSIHRLWAGTKLIVVLAFSALLAFYPNWVPLALVTILIGIAVWLARLPRGVVPSVPMWLWLLLLLGGVTATLGGGTPEVHVGSHAIALGGLLNFVRISVVSIVLLGLGMLVSWTTNIADIAPAVARLGRPMKIFRIPVDDWAVALALSLRAFPMLLDEFRLLYAARRLRPRPVLTSRRARRRRWAIEMVDLLAAGVTVALRRADEMGDAITARGGTGLISAAPSGPRRADWVVLAICAAVCAVSIGLQVTVLAGI